MPNPKQKDQKKLKVALVVQRYGLEVAGGAELHARWLAEHLIKYWDITILTTKAKDYVTWKNEYPKDKEIINNVPVLRFSVDQERKMEEFNRFSEKIFSASHHPEEEIEWIKKQGPMSSGLLNYLKRNSHQYQAFIFFQYLYAPTYFGLPLVKNKAFLIPTAHDEPTIYLKIFKQVFNWPRGIIPSTPEELALIRRVSQNHQVPACITGIGINLPPKNLINFAKIKKKFKLNRPFLLYMGRIEAGKGCHELFEFFQRYKANHPVELDLILTGKAVMDIPRRKDIKFLGFVSEEEKFSLLAGCQFLINPSQFESLSMIIMEAWLLEKAVLVNGRCQVLKGQCLRSNGGLWYTNYEEFEAMINWLLKHPQARTIMGQNGKKYVQANYSWKIIEAKFLNFIPKILRQNQQNRHSQPES